MNPGAGVAAAPGAGADAARVAGADAARVAGADVARGAGPDAARGAGADAARGALAAVARGTAEAPRPPAAPARAGAARRARGAWPGALNPGYDDWAGQRVWVVGASSGIGAALARELIAAGARVALSARRAEALAELARTAAPDPARGAPLVLPLDVTEVESLHAAARSIVATWGGIDLVLLLAGTHVQMRATSWDLERARRLIETNLFGVLNAVDAVLPVLRQQGAGGVAIVSSVAGYVGLPQALAYGPSKAALINFAESLYGDLRPLGIGVYLVNPGFVDTPLTRTNTFAMPALLDAADAARRTLAGIAAGRFEIHYPPRFTLWLKLLRVLPYRWQFAAVRRVTGL